MKHGLSAMCVAAARPLKGTVPDQGPGSHLVRLSPRLVGFTVPPAHLTHTPELLRPREASLDTQPLPPATLACPREAHFKWHPPR